MRRILAAITLLLAATAARAAEPGLATCSGTLAGAVRATFACDVSASVEADGTHLRITPRGAIAGVKSSVLADYVFKGRLNVGRYEDETRPAGVSKVVADSGASYAADGSIDAVIISIDVAERHKQTPNVVVVSGKLKAVLKGPGGKPGDVVTLDVAF